MEHDKVHVVIAISSSVRKLVMILHLIQLISIYALSGALAAVMTISRMWEGHFYGEFTLSASTATDDWRVHLIFNVPISNLEASEGIYVSHVRDGVEWSVSGKFSWSQVGDNEYIPISIEGDYDLYDAADDDIWGTAMVEAPEVDDYGYSQADPVVFISSTQTQFVTQTLPVVPPTAFSDSSVPVATPAPSGITENFPQDTESNDLSPFTTRLTTVAAPTTRQPTAAIGTTIPTAGDFQTAQPTTEAIQTTQPTSAGFHSSQSTTAGFESPQSTAAGFVTTQPPAGDSTTTKPPAVYAPTSQPPADGFITTQPPANGFIPTQPPVDGFVSNQPPAGDFVPTQPPMAVFQTSQPPAAAFQSTQSTPVPFRTTRPTVPAVKTTTSFLWSGPKSCERLVKVTQPPGSPRKYDYPLALAYSLLFYEAQRSGKLPENSRIPWRGDSALGDGQDEGLDLTGGWYDAGDNVKFGFPMASSTTVLLWGLLQWPDAYEATGQLEHMYDNVKWPLDYLIKCHTAPDELYVQVGDAELDHQYWGRPEDMYMERPSFKINATYPGSDVAAETAAAMAAGSIAFRKRDPAYADLLLAHAEELYKFANKHRGLYTDSVPEASIFYESSHYFDEIAWAACWLYKATWKEKYLTEAVDLYPAAVNVLPWAFSWDDKRIGVEALLWNLTQDPKYQYDMEYALRKWLPGGGWNYTTKGLAYLHRWGSLRYAENGAFIALMVADYGLSPDTYRPWAMAEMHYALGDSGQSFVVGFGENSPKNPHHRASSCPDMPAPCGWETFNTTRDNPQPLCGALVGGPDENDFYKDDRKDYVSSEVACDYNAGYQSALAGLIHLSMTGELPAY